MTCDETSMAAMRKMDMPLAQSVLIRTQSQSVARQLFSVAPRSPLHARLTTLRTIHLIRFRVGPSQWLADRQLPHLPPVLPSLGAVHVPASGPWS